MERQYTLIGYRASADEVRLLDSKVKMSGLTRSEFLRRLVEVAHVEPVKISTKSSNRSALVSQGQGEAVAL